MVKKTILFFSSALKFKPALLKWPTRASKGREKLDMIKKERTYRITSISESVIIESY